MFTVKFTRGWVTKILQAEEVRIYPVGPFSGTASEPENRTSDVREVNLVLDGRNRSFFIADTRKEKPHGWSADVEWFDAAYIENPHGATTEVVKPI